ncbi:MAG: ribosome recycling factor [Saprospiraceae bacterium]|nr:ribosome recycling factor [Saprospiraceae bacterium]MBP7699086.1 ribosome recycling factor [Saprospiraceae bacterium]
MQALDDINLYLSMTEEAMEHSVEHLNKELNKVRTGKASSNLLDGLMVEYYGAPTPLSQVANVATADSRTVTVQPWEKNVIAQIERAILEANIGITPQNDGQIIRLSIPPLTEERRKELVRKAKHLAEEAKVSVRNARRDAMEHIKKAQKNGLPEDMAKKKEDEVQKMTDKYSDRIEKLIEAKEKDILTL